MSSAATCCVPFAVGYYLLAWLSYRVAFAPSAALAAWWAPSGLALAALVRAKRWMIPWLLLGIVLGSMGLNFRQAISWQEMVFRSLSDCVEPLVSSLVLRRLAPDLRLRSLREVSAFAVIGVLLGPVCGTAVVGLGLFAFTSRTAAELGPFCLVWWGSAVLGVALFAPLFLTLRWPLRRLSPARLAEASLLGASLALLALATLWVPLPSVMTVVMGFAAFPLLAWAAMRFGSAGAARATVALSLFSVWPFIAAPLSPNLWEMTAVQGIYALGALTALTLAALSTEARDSRARAELQANRAEESLALLESALRRAPFGIAFFDRGLRITRVNEVFAGLCALPQAQLAGRELGEALPVDAERLHPLLRSALEGEGAVETDLETRNSARRHWICSAFSVRRADHPYGAGLLMMDVTERRRAQAERDRLFQEAQEAVRVREDFLSIASHELKTPLTPLAVRLRFIQRKLEAGEPVPPESIDKPLHSLRQLTELINDLLDASRIQSGRLLLHPEPQPFEELVRASVEPFLGASPVHRVLFEAPAESGWVHADRQRMAQVVTNLLDNAIKYSPAGGTVRVTLTTSANEVELSVRDEGIGIPAEHLGRLFERFYRASNASTSYGGLGLGLYITRDIVERHGGRIWAENAPDRGAVFHVVLPRIEPLELQRSLH